MYLLPGIIYSTFLCVMCDYLLNVCEFRERNTHHDSFLYATDSRIKYILYDSIIVVGIILTSILYRVVYYIGTIPVGFF